MGLLYLEAWNIMDHTTISLYQHYFFLATINIREIIKSRRMRWAGHVARMRKKRNVYRLLLGEPEEKRPLGRPRCGWMDNIKMNILEIVNVVD
jgi:hypothetical protein